MFTWSSYTHKHQFPYATFRYGALYHINLVANTLAKQYRPIVHDHPIYMITSTVKSNTFIFISVLNEFT